MRDETSSLTSLSELTSFFRKKGGWEMGFTCTIKVKVVNDAYSQTNNSNLHHKETQTVGTGSTEAQTVPQEVLTQAPPYDDKKLLSFLKKIEPHLEEELRKNDCVDNTLSGNGGIGPGCRGDEVVGNSEEGNFLREDKIISCLSWNTSCTALAIAYSETGHSNWCLHETSILIYNTCKYDFEKAPPAHILKVSSCVRCLKFHLYDQYTLAAGLHSGEVVLWKIYPDDETLMTNSEKSKEVHVDSINYLTWAKSNKSPSGVRLVTAGRDGRIIFWEVDCRNSTYKAQDMFLITSQYTTSATELPKHLEVHQMCFVSLFDNAFVVASTVNLFLCGLDGASIPGVANYKNPLGKAFRPHTSIVTALTAFRDGESYFFVSCSADSKIHMYTIYQEDPIHTIHIDYIPMGIEWVGVPNVFIWWGPTLVERHGVSIERGFQTAKTVCALEDGISVVTLKGSPSEGKGMAVATRSGEIKLFNRTIFTKDLLLKK